MPQSVLSSHCARLARPLASAAAALACCAALVLASPSAARAAPPPCAGNQICGLKNPEDFVRVPGSQWAIASRLARDPAAPAFSLVDLKRRTARALVPDFSGHASAAYTDCPGPPAASGLITHGLDIRRRPGGAAELFAVNHGGRQSIEVFDIGLRREGPTLKWKGCVILSAAMSDDANAVAALPDGLVVTSFGTPGPKGLAAVLAGRPGGFVERWTPHQGWARVAGSGFGGDNGVAASADGRELYVNDWGDGTLRVISLRGGSSPGIIRLGGFHADNLHWLPDGRLLIAGQVGTPRDILLGCSSDAACAVGSMIVIVDPRSRQVVWRRAVPPTATFAAASTALRYGSNYWLSSYRGDRVVCVGPAP